MAKRITNPISAVVTERNGVVTGRADYGVESEGVHDRRSIEVTFNANTLNDIHEEMVEAINDEEGTTGEPTPEKTGK